ncbi:MAG: autotransporter domain-containing protein [Parvibaculum sp.]|uniref:autotransporter domain-containing protein n=1 Tax=Parvibaculum sp. TaxID=2024848 RepID=UPI0025F4A518|nr:autotransporter domain-containing protein [Parvibaculum sp.]MCE9649759.1 autotransporter domain-containing protein [Parvibaculum sp.]
MSFHGKRKFDVKKTVRNVAAACLVAAGVPSQASAQDQYSQIIVYGDSYADNGNVVNNGYFDPSQPYPRHSSTNLGFLGFLVYPTSLQSLMDIPDSGMQNYAFGGATSGAGIPGFLLGFGQQINASLTLGQTFGPRDLVVINIGGNDGGASSGALTVSQAPGVAATAATNIHAGIQTLVAAGAQNIMLSTFDDTSEIQNIKNGSHGQGAIDAGKLYGSLLFSAVQTSLVPISESGVRIFTFNLSQFAREVSANQAAYGFTDILNPCQGTPGCATPTSSGQYTSITWDGLHLTTGGFLVVAKYMANILAAPGTFPAQADVAQSTASNFGTTLFGRLDAGRGLVASGGGSAGLYGQGVQVASTDKWVPIMDGGRLSLHVDATGATGSRDDRSGAVGYHYNSGGGSIGLDYRLDANVKMGVLFGYSNPHVSLEGGAGHIKSDTYQFGGYASFNYPHWFADVVTLYGYNDYRLDRPGIVDTVRGDTAAKSFTAAFKSAYLFNLGAVEAGPLVGLDYTHSRVDGYTETGDPLLTFSVADQTIISLTGSAGVQVRVPVTVGAQTLTPYLNVTAEHDFRDDGRTLLVTETQSPLLPIYMGVGGSGDGTYGKVQGGVSAALADNLDLIVSAASTFARGNGYDVAGGIGVNYRF